MSGIIKDNKKKLIGQKTTAEFRQNAARMVLDDHVPRQQAAQSLGVHYQSLCGWVKTEERSRNNADLSKYSTAEEKIEFLLEENKILKMEREILKKATAFFAKESKS